MVSSLDIAHVLIPFAFLSRITEVGEFSSNAWISPIWLQKCLKQLLSNEIDDLFSVEENNFIFSFRSWNYSYNIIQYSAAQQKLLIVCLMIAKEWNFKFQRARFLPCFSSISLNTFVHQVLWCGLRQRNCYRDIFSFISALHYASAAGRLEVVRIFLCEYSMVDLPDNAGVSAEQFSLNPNIKELFHARRWWRLNCIK